MLSLGGGMSKTSVEKKVERIEYLSKMFHNEHLETRKDEDGK